MHSPNKIVIDVFFLKLVTPQASKILYLTQCDYILETEFNLRVFYDLSRIRRKSAEYPPNNVPPKIRRKKIRPAEIGRKCAEKLGQPAANVKKIRLRGLPVPELQLKDRPGVILPPSGYR